MAKAAFRRVDFNGLFTYLQSNNSDYCIVPEEYFEHSKAYLIFESAEDMRNEWTPIQRCFYLSSARSFVLEKEAEVIA